MQLRPSKTQTIEAAIKLAPQYASFLREFEKSKGLRFFSEEALKIQNHYAQYVNLFDDELKIGNMFMLASLGKEGFKKLDSELNNLSYQEQQEWLEGINEQHEIVQAYSEIKLPETPEEIEAQKVLFESLPPDERKLAEEQMSYFWYFTFSSFFNTLSLMVHGTKLTTLVPLAIAGDDVAFLKAIQIDRLLLLHHPYFRDRKFRAQDEGDKDFLGQISYRESNPVYRSKIRYPALYMLFGILETYTWLDELKHREILDMCDEAGLDRFQNRIEDENCITKRLCEYRKWQKTGGVSMH